MPVFYFNVQDFSVDNVENVGAVTFYRGNLTGLSAVKRRFCQRSLRSTDSISIICNIDLPRVDLRYRGRYDISTGSSSSYRDHVQQRDFFGDISLRNIEAQIELQTSEDGDQYSVTNLLLLSKGEKRRGFQYNNVRGNRLYNNLFVPFEEISEPFYRTSFYVFQHIF
ncbi:uncharacterized protein TNCV_1878601 [Trichonephila clavipes]|nr:uncharacterized protein TNCV_1878601 [Trichonephila clavipes]